MMLDLAALIMSVIMLWLLIGTGAAIYFLIFMVVIIALVEAVGGE